MKSNINEDEEKLLESEENLTELQEVTTDDSDRVEQILEFKTYSKTEKLKEIARKILKKWFFIGLVSTVILAWLVPQFGRKGGPLKPEYTVQLGVIPFIFLLSGLTIPTRDIANAIFKIKILLFTQSFIFGVIPIFMFLISILLRRWSINNYIVDGLIVMSCFPSTTTTCVVLTRASNGDEAASLFSAVFSSIIGVFISPLLLSIYLSSTAEVPFVSVIVNLMVTVLLPLFVGQVILNILTKLNRKHWLDKIPNGILSNGMILFVVYTVFSDAFIDGGSVSNYDWIVMITILFACYVLFFFTVFFVSGLSFLNFTRKERIAILFCATHKTMGMGIPLINALYGSNPNRYLVFLPIMIYHPLQLLYGSFASSPLFKWSKKDELSPVSTS